MIIYPAIDLLQGNCVRLTQGDYSKEKVYFNDPMLVAKNFINQGASWLHVVDLNGAKNPKNTQSAMIIELMKQNSNTHFQIGGGIREKNQIMRFLDNGANRIVIGSRAISNPKKVLNWLKFFGSERMTIALDIFFENNIPKVMTNAWHSVSQYSIFDLISYFQKGNIQNVLCTNTQLDGTLKGPDYLLYENLLSRFPFLKLQASGGIKDLSDLSILQNKKVAGTIVGRALYENKFTLSEAINVSKTNNSLS